MTKLITHPVRPGSAAVLVAGTCLACTALTSLEGYSEGAAGGTAPQDAGSDVSTGGTGAQAGMGGVGANSGTGGITFPDGSADALDSSNGIPLGYLCTSDGECESDLCLPDPSGESYCAQFCCGTHECPADAICFPYYGSNICLSPALLGLPPPGTATTGDSCVNNSDCRSSRCVETRCLDVCCLDGDCALRACALRYGSLHCAHYAPGTKLGPGEPCTIGTECDSNVCYSTTCTGNCCTNADCASSEQCDYVVRATNMVVRQCIPAISGQQYLACCSDLDCVGSERCLPVFDSVFPSGSDWAMRCR